MKARSILEVLAATVLVILVLEGLLRVVAYAWTGGSEYYLLYGFHGLAGRVDISPWSVADGSHYKFPPNYTLEGAAGQGEETARTNALGFRGPDFDPRRPANTFRVIALGGSSTFGFHNSDTGTYPYLLQELLSDAFPEGPRVEVINAGFPYYNTGSIRGLVESELLTYDPDILTLYSAYNDAQWPLHVGNAFRTTVWVQRHSMIYLLLKQYAITDERALFVRRALTRMSPAADRSVIESRAEEAADRYRANVEAIADRAAQRGILFVVIRQPVTASHEDPTAYRSYEEEYHAVHRKLSGGEPLSNVEIAMFIHHRLIAELDAIARERGLPVVDNIAIVDRDRDRLTTWVHLTEEANLALAEALKETIEPYLRERNGGRGQISGGRQSGHWRPSRDDRGAYEPERSRVLAAPGADSGRDLGIGWLASRSQGRPGSVAASVDGPRA